MHFSFILPKITLLDSRPLWLPLLCVMVGCGSQQRENTTLSFAEANNRPICVVLSVGGPAGLAHLGALRAIQRSDLKVNCVVGNSMGALVGGLYAAAPMQDAPNQYKQFSAAYVEETKRVAKRSGLLGFLFGAALTVATGGAAGPVILAGGAGAFANASATEQRDLERTVAVLDEFVEGIEIQNLPVQYANFHHVTTGTGVALQSVQHGRLAHAIGKSIANPLIFPGFDALEAGYVDPGTDRVAAVPVNDACKLFPGRRLLVLNVTGQSAFYPHDIDCPVLEVQVAVDAAPAEAMLGTGAAFQALVARGERVTRSALVEAGFRVR